MASLFHTHIDLHAIDFFLRGDTIVTVIVLVLLLDFLYGIRVPGLLIEFREDSSVERHADSVILLDKVIEHALHEAMRSQR